MVIILFDKINEVTKMKDILGECGRDDCDNVRYLANRCRKHYSEEMKHIKKMKIEENEMV